MKRIGRYEIIDLIYEGMLAKSYKAYDPLLNRKVFLKIMHPNLSSDNSWIRRFEREARIQAKLKHPNIVTIYELGKDKNFFIASEYVEGCTLKDLIVKNGRVEMRELSNILIQVINALEYLHEKGIVHRDIKPQNILISKTNDVKLADFGLAFSPKEDSITQQGFTLGTPEYMSPEQAIGKKVDFRSDIFSLGVTIYESLSGKNPFRGESYADSINKIINFRQINLSRSIPDLPASVADIVDKMLIKDKERRLSSLNKVKSVFIEFAESRFLRTKVKRKSKRAALIYAILILPLIMLFFALNYEFHKDREISRVAEVINTEDSTLGAEDPRMSPSPRNRGSKRSHLPAPKECVDIWFEVSPWANIYIDGESVATTPFVGELRLNKGKHTIVLRNPYYPSIVDSVNLTRPCTLVYDFEKRYAFIDLEVNPWGIIYLDGILVDTTPLSRPIPITLGHHKIEIVHNVLGKIVKDVVIDSARVYHFSFDYMIDSPE